MKYVIVALLVLASATAFARVKIKDPMVITDSVTISSSAKPDIMESGMTVQYKSQNYAAVASAMEKITGAVKKSKDICTFSGYRISPEYQYVDGKQINDGYMGYLDFDCKFNSAPVYEAVGNDVFAIADADSAYLLTSKQIRWSVSRKVMDAQRSQMKIEAIKTVLRTARDYSRASGLHCTPKDINLEYNDFSPVAREYSAVRASKTSIQVSEPDKTDQTVSLSVKYNYVCR
ncbi:SIMPL domain-containing protein [Seleniivibrio sp.]|uniref:SIMPL domain-containing protein n=1 Tax=Seleniivibrio sp. TaxID=2898801 RepID=UPI0025DB5B6E|nr:SIMPL domain-containing protein [Seleniivibrio sp.]MCD8552563.1 SIMPL domain-containing protein [Seleniivibrio sp.]